MLDIWKRQNGPGLWTAQAGTQRSVRAAAVERFGLLSSATVQQAGRTVAGRQVAIAALAGSSGWFRHAIDAIRARESDRFALESLDGFFE